MSQERVLKSLEQVLEAFLDRVVAYKQPRLQVLEGINRLDEIARTPSQSTEITDQIGEWFAANNRLLSDDNLRAGDITRIGDILGEIKLRLDLGTDAPPAVRKISSEIDRWRTNTGRTEKITLHRPPETVPAPQSTPGPTAAQPRPVVPEDSDSIARFDRFLKHAMDLYTDYAGNKKHLLSVLDDLLTAAELRQNKDALILSGFLIYYLKLGNYKVEPFVRRLKKAEEILKGGRSNA